ncbi:competence protein ComK [Neobacillus niacini]|uniref:competence protein ComK n=1 Tax=Neobacillus niacini TaxID=86668 RepID=UPI0028556DAB|nr:competence protein ComK [Neobacillus niacini]MDR7077512.1 competence protein ComK [Neobacillus niacini]
MEIRDTHLLNEKTVLVTGEYNNRGELWSRVIEGEETFLVRKAPIAIIEETLLHVGSDFLGARRSSKYLLSPMRMHPISINPQMGILLFPTQSMKCYSCIWFSLIHVKTTKSIGINKTEVLTSFGHTILLDMAERAFKNRRHNAIQLQETISKNLKCPLYFYVEPKMGFYISKSPKDNNFTLEKK